MWTLPCFRTKSAGIVLALFLTAVSNQASLALTMSPSRTGLAVDTNLDGIGESGVGTSILKASRDFPFPGGNGETRGIAIFQISSLSDPVAAAHLFLVRDDYVINAPFVDIGIYGKAGDMNVDGTDFALGTLGGTFTFNGQPFVSVDITSLINSFITSVFPPPPDFLTLQIVWLTAGHSDDFVSFSQPVLEIEQTPLPAALPLFASGLSAIGFIARRRNRKKRGVLANRTPPHALA